MLALQRVICGSSEAEALVNGQTLEEEVEEQGRSLLQMCHVTFDLREYPVGRSHGNDDQGEEEVGHSIPLM